MRTRDPNLDLLRATAILLVLVAHVTPRWPGVAAALAGVATFGVHGVDLFFVLSGWLIGGLLWREQVKFGDVEVGRFIARRALRTMPPYFIALGVCYATLLVTRHTPFDWGFLLFLQNYYHRIPYFLISWSLCVEEHFYLVMPFAAVLLSRLPSRPFLVPLLALVPMACRAFTTQSGDMMGIGYPDTATHLHCEGLILGVWASFLRNKHPEAWASFRRFCVGASVPLLIVAVAADFLPDRLHYVFFDTIIAAFFLCLLVAVVERQANPFSGSRAIFWVASTSYSVYLTHSAVLEAALRLINRMPPVNALRLPVMVLCIAGVGFAFYRCVEIPSLAARHRWMPARSGGRSPLLDPVLATATPLVEENVGT